MNYIVEPEWAKENLDDLLVIDCRFFLQDPLKGRQEYEIDHIPGAHHFDLDHDLSGPKQKHGGRHPLPPLENLRGKLEEAGAANDKTILLYDSQNGAMASRLWWLLNYMGHSKAFILNGGYDNWKNKGYPVTAALPEKTQKGHFQPVIQEHMKASAQEIFANLPSIEKGERYLIDSREQKRYLGIEEPIDHKAGHIPGAHNYFWGDNLDGGDWKNQETLKERFSDLDPTKEVIVYCGSGVTACPNILALKEAGFTDVKLYPGSWSDWISYEDYPISDKSRK
ncbi:sulfurtransferase [Bacillus tianshenii]|uniref:sulfurtransferase n=1 Tax=Sutcliffiella tianshenii TaxID=1463404 RepID=UPI001CD6F3FB|nr:sulfurtransferase [Bacillus tianshenii]MCA1321174.1 sulfurtransferase [Bacillus tianshenii]